MGIKNGETLEIVVCPYCGKIKIEGKWKFEVTPLYMFFQKMCKKRVKTLRLIYEECYYCSKVPSLKEE